MTSPAEKYEILQQQLRNHGAIAVAFSSGVDSTFLLKAAHDTLGDRAVAITVRSSTFPKDEVDQATEFCRRENIRHITVDIDVFGIDGFDKNPPNRCYLCKKTVFSKIRAAALELGINNVAEGSNLDDLNDYRPGMRAVAELGILSPLRDAQLTKQDIRTLSRELGLPTWNKPSFACLSSRFVYGEKITPQKLSMVGSAEQYLRSLGITQARVRIHAMLARIEVLPDDIPRIIESRNDIDIYLKSLGFTYVTMDLKGYRTGSMNEVLRQA